MRHYQHMCISFTCNVIIFKIIFASYSQSYMLTTCGLQISKSFDFFWHKVSHKSKYSILQTNKATEFKQQMNEYLDTIQVFPELIVFDLDQCMWSPETYTLEKVPTEASKVIGKLGNLNEEGVTGLNCGSNEILKLFPGALFALQQYLDGRDSYFKNTKLAVASTAVTATSVQIAHQSLSLLEVKPGVSVREVLSIGWEHKGSEFSGNIKIGRSAPLTTSKAKSHFPLIQQETGINFDKMLYFDDCNWDDHCYEVETRCKFEGKGVTTYKTPIGLQINDWKNALIKYSKANS